MTDFDPQAWLELGYANRDKLPDGVFLPEPEIDYERYRAVLQRFYKISDGFVEVATPLDSTDRDRIHGLLAVADEVVALRDGPKADGWIEWHGGECPVPPGTMVEVRMRCGPMYPGHRNVGAASTYDWDDHAQPYDIVAYRVVQEN